ncbi:MAG: zinc-dependent alcohol dehydrogenase [Methylocystaceae bacterium]
MKALYLWENQRLSLEETDAPVLIDETDVIVRVTASSICGSDVHFWKGHIPYRPGFIIGHEFVGVIEQVGSKVSKFKPGDRVSAPAAPFCGICPSCRAGKEYACTNGKGMFGGGGVAGVLPGAQAELIRILFADTCLVKIPESVSDKAALLVGDVLSTGYFAVINGAPQPGDDIVIFGAGPVGLCAVACANLFSPARLIVVDIEENRLEVALSLGATQVLNPQKGGDAKEIRRLTGGQGAHLAIDAVGLPATLQQSIKSTCRGGTISMVGIGPPVIEFPMAEFFFKNLTLKGGYVPLNQMQRLMQLIEVGKLDVSALITHQIGLSDIIGGYEMFASKKDGCIKVMVVPD